MLVSIRKMFRGTKFTEGALPDTTSIGKCSK